MYKTEQRCVQPAASPQLAEEDVQLGDPLLQPTENARRKRCTRPHDAGAAQRQGVPEQLLARLTASTGESQPNPVLAAQLAAEPAEKHSKRERK